MPGSKSAYKFYNAFIYINDAQRAKVLFYFTRTCEILNLGDEWPCRAFLVISATSIKKHPQEARRKKCQYDVKIFYISKYQQELQLHFSSIILIHWRPRERFHSQTRAYCSVVSVITEQINVRGDVFSCFTTAAFRSNRIQFTVVCLRIIHARRADLIRNYESCHSYKFGLQHIGAET